MRHITANTGRTIPLGRRGENQATEVSFDVSAWLKDYPAGEIRLIAQRQGDAYPYPVVTTRHNNTIRWTVSAADSGVQGFGVCELQLWAGEMLMKSRPFATYTATALEDPAEVPDVLEPYYQRLDELIAEAEAAAAAGVVPEAVWIRGQAEGTEVTITDGADDKPLVQLRVSMTPRTTAPGPDQPIPIPGYTSATLSITETSDDDTRETELSLDFIPLGETEGVTCHYGYVDLIPGTLHAFGEIFRPTEADSVEDYSTFYKLARFTIPETYAVQHLRCNKAITLLRAPNAGELLTEGQAYCRIDESNPEELLLYYHQAIPLTNLLSGIEFFLPTAAEQVISIAPQDVRTHGGYHMTISLPESDAYDTCTLSVIWRRDATTYFDNLALDVIWDVINANRDDAREMLCRIVAAGEEHLSASRNITEGELIVVNGRLAVATANIAAGAGIVFGGNVQETSLAAELAGGSAESSVFVARFGSTTSAEIEAAYQAGKVVLVPITRYHTVARLTGRESATLHHFGAVYSSVGGTPLCAIAATCSADDWSAIEITLARQVNIATNTFSDESTYSVGDYVLYNGLLYRFTAAHTGAWAAGDAVRVQLADDVQELRAALNGKGTYSKPSGGIPKTDLAAAVRTSLGKADTALQEHQSLSGYATQQWVGQQGYLTQHQDISGKADRVTEVTVSSAGAVTQALEAGKLYHFTGAITALTLTLTAPAAGQLAQYHFDFLAGATAPTLTLPNSVVMPDSFSVEANKRYEVDILNNFGAVMAWANS